MKYIEEQLIKENPSIEDLIGCFEQVKNNGDVAVIKFDGLRAQDQYTVFISFSSAKSKEMIRVDDSSLKTALLKVLMQYIQVNP